MRYCDDGRLEIDNNAAERSLRAVVLGRKNYLFRIGRRGERAAAIYSLIGTAKLNGSTRSVSAGGAVPHRRSSHQSHRGTLPWNLAPNSLETQAALQTTLTEQTRIPGLIAHPLLS